MDNMEIDNDDFPSKKPKQDKDVMATDIETVNGVPVSVGSSTNLVKSSASVSNNSTDHNGSTSDLSFQEDTNDDEVDADDDDDGLDEDEAFDDGDNFGNDDEVASDYGDDDDDDDEYIDDDDDDYLKLQAQFDHADLPTGVEATFAWLQDPPSEDKPSASGPSTSRQEDKSSGASSSEADTSLKIIKEETMDDVLRKLMYFKQFDTVSEFSDHHFGDAKPSGRQPSKSWAKKIQDEWKILEHNLPETIYVRVDESRMELLRAVIVGPAETPYHDGLFVFDVVFPPSYPSEPPV